MGINYREEVDSGFDRKRIIERAIINCLRDGIPLEIIEKSQYFIFKHKEMLGNLQSGYASKKEKIAQIYDMLDIDFVPLNFAEVSHPVGGELYPMTPEEEKKKFLRLQQIREALECKKDVDVSVYEKKREQIINDMIDFKLKYPIINNIIDCVYLVENEEKKIQGNLSLERIVEIFKSNNLDSNNLSKYNKIYDEYKKLEFSLDEATKEYNDALNKKVMVSNTYDLVRQKKALEQEIVMRNTKLVNGFIRSKYNRLIVEADDLFQVCYFGLWKAVQVFDVSKGYKFSSLAYAYMDGEIKHQFKELTGLRWEAYWTKENIKLLLSSLSSDLGYDVSVSDLEDFGVLPVSVEVANSLLNSDYLLPWGNDLNEFSMNKKNQVSDNELYDNSYWYGEESENDDLCVIFPFDDMHSLNQLREDLNYVLNTLTGREADCLKLRFGIDGNRPHSLEEVGKVFNVTRECVRQIEAKALRKLRHPSRSKKVKNYLDFNLDFTEEIVPRK